MWQRCIDVNIRGSGMMGIMGILCCVCDLSMYLKLFQKSSLFF